MKLELELLKDQEQKARHAKTEFRKDDGKKFSRINLRKVVTGRVGRVFRSATQAWDRPSWSVPESVALARDAFDRHCLYKRLAKMTKSEIADMLDSLSY